MRLVCPGCGAQYEIDGALIPPTGRDVQCSSCGHGWFQEGAQPASMPEGSAGPEAVSEFGPQDRLHETARKASVRGVVPSRPSSATPPASEADRTEAQKTASLGTDSAAEGSPPQHTKPPEPDPMDAILRALETAPATRDREAPEANRARALPNEDTDDPQPDAAEVAPTPDIPRPSDDVMEILRSEAAREQAARRAEAEAQSSFESQGELDMAPPPRRASVPQTPEDPALPPRTEPPFADADEDTRLAAAGRVARPRRPRDPFPDVDEVSSQLGTTGSRELEPVFADDDPKGARARRTGMRVGFAGMLLVTAGALVVYGQATVLSERLPALDAPLDTYVDWVNGLRIRLDQVVRDVASAVRGAT